MTFTEEEKKGFEADTKKAREFRLALEQDMNVSWTFIAEMNVAEAHDFSSLPTCSP